VEICEAGMTHMVNRIPYELDWIHKSDFELSLQQRDLDSPLDFSSSPFSTGPPSPCDGHSREDPHSKQLQRLHGRSRGSQWDFMDLLHFSMVCRGTLSLLYRCWWQPVLRNHIRRLMFDYVWNLSEFYSFSGASGDRLAFTHAWDLEPKVSDTLHNSRPLSRIEYDLDKSILETYFTSPTPLLPEQPSSSWEPSDVRNFVEESISSMELDYRLYKPSPTSPGYIDFSTSSASSSAEEEVEEEEEEETEGPKKIPCVNSKFNPVYSTDPNIYEDFAPLLRAYFPTNMPDYTDYTFWLKFNGGAKWENFRMYMVDDVDYMFYGDPTNNLHHDSLRYDMHWYGKSHSRDTYKTRGVVFCVACRSFGHECQRRDLHVDMLCPFAGEAKYNHCPPLVSLLVPFRDGQCGRDWSWPLVLAEPEDDPEDCYMTPHVRYACTPPGIEKKVVEGMVVCE